MTNFSAHIPVAKVGAANAELEAQGFGPNNFSVPVASAGAVGADFAALHTWGHDAFRAAVEALDAGLGVVITDGTGTPNLAEACTKAALTWKPYDGDAAGLPMKGATVSYGGKTWTNLVDRNPFAPPINYREQGTNPAWTQPTAKEDAYPLAFSVSHKGKVWESLLNYNTGEPGVSGWRETVATGYPAWVAPSGAHDAYKLNAKVSHKSKNWNNTGSDANVFEPGVFGWVVIA